jgi:hypothetical protein
MIACGLRGGNLRRETMMPCLTQTRFAAAIAAGSPPIHR